MRGMRAAASRSIHREVGVAAERRGPGFWLRGAEAMPAIRGRDEHQNLEPALRFLQSHAAELAQARGAVHGSAPNQVGSDPAMAGSQSFYFALLLMPDAVPCGLSHTPRYRAELPEGLACRGRPVVATEAWPSVACTRWMGAPRSRLWLAWAWHSQRGCL